MTEALQKSIAAQVVDRTAASRAFDFKREVVNFLSRSNSIETRRTYANHLKEFFAFNKLKFPAEITDEDVIRWRDRMKRAGRKDTTVKTKLAAVRSFFEYLYKKGFIANNPANKYLVPPPKVADTLRGRALEPKEIKYLLSLPRTGEVIGARDYALMMLMLRTFMRVSEALSLRDTDFFSRKGVWYVQVKIKGGESKQAPIPLEVKKAIDRYLFLDREQRDLIKTREGEGKFVFLPSKDKKRHFSENRAITARHAWHIVRRYGEQLFMADILKMKRENPSMSEKAIKDMFRLTPHDFRRTAITKALDQNESYRRVQNAARLKNIATVRRYDQHRESVEENSILTLNYDEV